MRRLFLLGLLLSSFAYAKGRSTELKDGRFVLYGMGDLLFSDSKADHESATTYTRKYNKSFVVAPGLGMRLFGFLYLGARYEYWIAGREFSSSSTSGKDTLKYQTIGGEVGWYTGNPRIHWILSATVHYPLSLTISQTGWTSGKYNLPNDQRPLSYSGRLTLGIKFSSSFSLRLEGGYRVVNLGDLHSAPRTYLPAGASLDLSGPFLGAGFGLHF